MRPLTGSPGSGLAIIWIAREMGHTKYQPLFMPNKCVPCTEQTKPDTSVCRADTGAIETCSYCHISQRVSPFSVNSNICSKYYGYHKTLTSLLQAPASLLACMAAPSVARVWPPGSWGSTTLRWHHHYHYHYHYNYNYQELDFLAKVSLSVLRSPDTRLRARMGGLGDQAPRNRWEVSTDNIVITCLQPDSLNKRLTV